MGQFSQIDIERINHAVSDCNIMRLTVYETQAWIKDRLNIDLSYKTVKNYRSRQKASARQWIAKLAKSRRGDYIAQYRERILEIETIQQELWKLMRNTQNPIGARIRAADVLLQCTSHMVQLYDSMPVIKSLGDYINQNQNQQPPPSTSSLNRDYDWGSYDRNNNDDLSSSQQQQPPNDDDGNDNNNTGIRIPGRDRTDEDYR